MSHLLSGSPLWALLFIWLFALDVKSFKVTGAIGGLETASGDAPSRYEINDFASSGPAFDLYILALQSLQDQNQSDPLSYFQVAGIHGYPVTPWDGVIGEGPWPGYCMHASVLFPTWHRPYVALFEQLISARAQTIARTYPIAQRDQYQDAAKSLRVPYWDWASRPELPSVVASPVISINTPYGYYQMQNPLYMYKFHPGEKGDGFPSAHPLSGMSTTVRYYDAATGRSNNSAASAVLRANAPSTLGLTYQLLTSTLDYTTVSCAWIGAKSNGPYNIENVHNNIHNFVGGPSGHMTWPELSAFDPVFWLHHANVDRLLALWQAMHPQSYVVPVTNLYGSYYEVVGTVDSISTSLAPFHADNGTTMYTSDSVRDIAAFCYTYPELLNQNLSTADRASDVTRKLNQLYAPSVSRRMVGPALQRRASSVEQAFSHVTFEMVKSLGVSNREVQWSVGVAVNRNSSVGPFTIDFFMGTIPPIGQSSTAPNLVGSYSQFMLASLLEYGSSKGLTHGGLSITHTLVVGMERGFLEDLSPASVVPVLRDHLYWRARSDIGGEIDLESLSGLLVSVQSRQVKPRESLEQVPLYGESRTHYEATAGKIGGMESAKRGDESGWSTSGK